MKIRQFILNVKEFVRADCLAITYDLCGVMIAGANGLSLVKYMAKKLYAAEHPNSGIMQVERLRRELGQNYVDIANAIWGGARCCRRTKWIRRWMRREFGLPRFVPQEPESHKRNRYRDEVVQPGPQPTPYRVQGTITGRMTGSYVPSQVEDRAHRPYTRMEITAWSEHVNQMFESEVQRQLRTAQ